MHYALALAGLLSFGCISSHSSSYDKSAAGAAADAGAGAGGRAAGGAADLEVTTSPDGTQHFIVKGGGGSSAATAAAEAAAAAAARAEASGEANAKKTETLEVMLWGVLAWIGARIACAGLVSLGWLAKNPFA
jgi:hypothetical protein